MSAPENITAPYIARYEPVLDALRPGFIGDERRKRCGVLYLRDRAMAALRVAGWEAGQVLHAIQSIATVHALRPMPPGELDALHYGLCRLMGVATDLENLGPQEGSL